MRANRHIRRAHACTEVFLVILAVARFGCAILRLDIAEFAGLVFGRAWVAIALDIVQGAAVEDNYARYIKQNSFMHTKLR